MSGVYLNIYKKKKLSLKFNILYIIYIIYDIILNMKHLIRVYKNLISEEDRLLSVQMFDNYPNSILTQSVCTDEPVYQLRDYLPISVAKTVYTMHENIIPRIESDFELDKDSIKLMKPNYLDANGQESLTVDKRVPGMSLPIHRDIPTGTYEKHYGLENGTTAITMTGVFYWNDDFEGGELQFVDETLTKFGAMSVDERLNDSILKEPFIYKPVAGDFVVFPSFLYHTILEIRSGHRYSTQYFFNRTESYHVSELPNYETNYLEK